MNNSFYKGRLCTFGLYMVTSYFSRNPCKYADINFDDCKTGLKFLEIFFRNAEILCKWETKFVHILQIYRFADHVGNGLMHSELVYI